MATTVPPLTAAERREVEALFATFLPPLTREEAIALLAREDADDVTPSEERIASVMRSGATPEAVDAFEAALREHVLPSEAAELRLALRLLGSRWGACALTGDVTSCLSGGRFDDNTCSAGRRRTKGFFSTLDAATRDRLLLGMAASRVPQRRKAFHALKRLCLFTATAALDPKTGRNAHWAAANVSPPQYDEERPPTPDAYFEWPVVPESEIHAEVDVVVVGTGCGGAVAASKLARRGYSVISCEKATAGYSPDEFKGLELDAFKSLYERAGLVASADGSFGLLAGSAFGGGSTVNWGCSLRTPKDVQSEWAQKAGLYLSTNDAGTFLDKALDEVCERLEVVSGDAVSHNPPNRALLRGCDKLKLKCRAAPQNLTDTKSDDAFLIGYGDRFANKRSTPMTYLRDAARTKRWRVSPGTAVVRVLRDSNTGRAVGVEADRVVNEGTCTILKVRYTARRAVILAAGALQTPCILLRSGSLNRNVGRHLRIHPVVPLLAEFPSLPEQGEEDGNQSNTASSSSNRKRRCFALGRGAPMTTVATCCRTRLSDGRPYGALIEVPHAGLGLACASVSWRGGLDAKRTLIRADRLAAFIVLQRDSGEGSVELSQCQTGPVVKYALDSNDADSMSDALATAAKVAAAAGATRVSTLHLAHPVVVTSSSSSSSSNEGSTGEGKIFLDPDAVFRKVTSSGRVETNADTLLGGLFNFPNRGRPNSICLLSAHQMGTCRLGIDPTTSVVDPNGHAWDLPGLYVADTSLFPTASGVNPMLSCMALATRVADRLVDRLARAAAAKGGETLPHGDDDYDDDAARVARWDRAHRRAQAAQALEHLLKFALLVGGACIAAGTLAKRRSATAF